MNGRVIFLKFRPLLKALIYIVRFFPQFVRGFAWNVVGPFDGVLACGIRYVILTAAGACLGDNVFVGHHVTVRNASGLCVGSNVSIHTACYIDAIGGVTIGDDVSIAHGTSIVSFNHKWTDPVRPIKYNDVELDSIEIENDVWIGCGVRILAGSCIARRTIVAAGAVLPGYKIGPGVVAGVPARVVKKIVV